MAGLFGSQKASDPVRMPNQNDAAAQEAKRRTRLSLLGRQGRDSTNLENRGGGGMGAYVNSKLGQ